MTPPHPEAGASAALEREVKLDAPIDLTLPDLADVAGSVAVRDADPVDLDATYFDTAELSLHEAGVSLRRRTGEGTRWTAKLPEGRVDDALGATVRREIDLHDDAPTPPADARALVEPYAAGAPLEPVARIVSHRRRRLLSTAGDDRGEGDGPSTLAEIDDDEVEVRGPATGEVVARFREIEVEFAAEAPAELVAAVVDRLLAAGATRSGGVSKVDRALGLLGRS